MSGIKNIKKKLKGFQVRPPNVEVLKKVLLHIPYVVVFYVVNKCTWLYQYCRGSTVSEQRQLHGRNRQKEHHRYWESNS